MRKEPRIRNQESQAPETTDTGQPEVEPEAGTRLPVETEAGAVARLEAETSRLQDELSELNDRYLRALADLDNIRRRFRQDKEEAIRYGVGSLLLDMLPVLDNLGRALEAARETQDVASLMQGVEITHAQFEQALAKRGVVPIPALGLPFDPQLHEAVARVPTNKHPEATVLSEIETGFMMEGKVLRPSKVAVSVAPQEEQTGQ